METWLLTVIHWLLATLALPTVGLSAIFLVSLISATLLPLGSEPAVFGYIKIAPTMFWPAILVATLGNTLGGLISYYTGLGAQKAYENWREDHPKKSRRLAGGRWHAFITRWVEKLGVRILLFSWLPIIGDPICAVAGWFRLPLIPSIIYMAVGKFLRYVVMTTALLWIFPNLS